MNLKIFRKLSLKVSFCLRVFINLRDRIRFPHWFFQENSLFHEELLDMLVIPWDRSLVAIWQFFIINWWMYRSRIFNHFLIFFKFHFDYFTITQSLPLLHICQKLIMRILLGILSLSAGWPWWFDYVWHVLQFSRYFIFFV